jgi:hypothetical protein
VVEDVVIVLDEENGDAIVDDSIVVSHDDGSVEFDEVVTAVFGADGSAETVADVDADGNARGQGLPTMRCRGNARCSVLVTTLRCQPTPNVPPTDLRI